jgi:hypothetical protein
MSQAAHLKIEGFCRGLEVLLPYGVAVEAIWKQQRIRSHFFAGYGNGPSAIHAPGPFLAYTLTGMMTCARVRLS